MLSLPGWQVRQILRLHHVRCLPRRPRLSARDFFMGAPQLWTWPILSRGLHRATSVPHADCARALRFLGVASAGIAGARFSDGNCVMPQPLLLELYQRQHDVEQVLIWWTSCRALPELELPRGSTSSSHSKVLAYLLPADIVAELPESFLFVYCVCVMGDVDAPQLEILRSCPKCFLTRR